MKRRFFTLMLVVAMLAMTLVGCGETTDTTDTTNNDTNVETDVEVDAPTDDTVVEDTADVPVVDDAKDEANSNDDVVNGEDDKPVYEYATTWEFPIGMDGFTNKYLNEEYPNWSVNYTHGVAANGNEMNFRWEGPIELGEIAGVNGNTIALSDSNNNFEISAWSFPISTNEEALSNYDKEEIISWNASVTPYINGEYYEFIEEETTSRVIFKVTSNRNGVEYTGYACYVDNYETMVCYQMVYLENNETFDDSRALAVVKSFDFWNYIPE